MSAQDTMAGEAIVAPDIKVNKKIVPFEEGSPDEEPLFVNCLQVAHAGGVAYIDVGVIPPTRYCHNHRLQPHFWCSRD
jgi:hypothetical protein